MLPVWDHLCHLRNISYTQNSIQNFGRWTAESVTHLGSWFFLPAWIFVAHPSELFPAFSSLVAHSFTLHRSVFTFSFLVKSLATFPFNSIVRQGKSRYKLEPVLLLIKASLFYLLSRDELFRYLLPGETRGTCKGHVEVYRWQGSTHPIATLAPSLHFWQESFCETTPNAFRKSFKERNAFFCEFSPKPHCIAARGGWQKTAFSRRLLLCQQVLSSASPCRAGKLLTHHSYSQCCQPLPPAGCLQGTHPLLTELCLEELGGDLMEKVLQCQGLRVRL